MRRPRSAYRPSPHRPSCPPSEPLIERERAITTDLKRKIEEANAEAVQRLNDAEPVLVDVAPAGEVVPGMKGRVVHHSGPPITWDRMCGAQRGAVMAMAIFEGWAKSVEEAAALLASGGVRLDPNHHHQSVGPMAGSISPSLPVWVVENKKFGNRAYCRLAEGRQQFGDYSQEAINCLRMWRDVWAPSIRAGIRKGGPFDLKPIIAKALQMGDELHNRPNAASSLFAGQMALRMIDADVAKPDLLKTVGWMTNNDFLFLGLSMGCGKAATDPACGIGYSTMVTAMSRNGTEFGIRVSGLGNEWFTAPAPKINGLYIPGFSEKDAGLDMGDSAITETVGWGGFVLGGAPGILSLTGGTPEQAMAYSRDMQQVTIARSPSYLIPALGFQGAPTGIDIRKVVQTGIAPIIDTAIAHKDPGYPLIGAGLVRAPMDCFKRALVAFAKRYGV